MEVDETVETEETEETEEEECWVEVDVDEDGDIRLTVSDTELFFAPEEAEKFANDILAAVAEARADATE